MNHKKVVIADFDGTLIAGQSQVLLINYLFSKKEISLISFLEVIFWNIKYKFISQKIDKELVEKLYSLLLREKNEAWVEPIMKDFVDNVLTRKVFDRTLGMLIDYKKNGYEIILLSSSTDIILKAFNKKYNIADKMICTLLEKQSLEFTGRIKGEINDSKVRERAIKTELEKIQPTEIIVMSDNLTDIGLFRLANKAIVVNPCKKLSSFAKENNFEIINI